MAEVALAGKTRAPQLESKAAAYTGPIYKPTRVPPINNGSSTQLVGPGSSLDVNFLITPRVFNFAQSQLYYNINQAAEAKCFVFANEMTYGEIQSISLTPENGKTIAEVQEARNYLHIINPMITPREKFMDSTKEDALYPNELAAAASNLLPMPPIYGTAAGTFLTGSLPYREAKYLDTGAALAGAYPVANGVRVRRVDFSRFKGTIFALDKDIYFPQNMVLKVTFSLQKFGFAATGAADPTTGAIALTGNLSLTNLNLMLQVESNPDIAQQVTKHFSNPSGVVMPIETLKFFKSSQSGNQHNPQLNLSSGDGRLVKRIIVAPFAQTETVNYALDHSNFTAAAGTITGGGKVLSYRTNLDTEPLQKNEISCVPANDNVGVTTAAYPSDDWQYNRKFTNGSAIQDINAYRKNWFHIEDFMGAPDWNSVDAFNVGGLPLNSPHKYEVVAQVCQDATPAYLTLNWYIYAIIARELIISPTTIDLR